RRVRRRGSRATETRKPFVRPCECVRRWARASFRARRYGLLWKWRAVEILWTSLSFLGGLVGNAQRLGSFLCAAHGVGPRRRTFHTRDDCRCAKFRVVFRSDDGWIRPVRPGNSVRRGRPI